MYNNIIFVFLCVSTPLCLPLTTMASLYSPWWPAICGLPCCLICGNCDAHWAPSPFPSHLLTGAGDGADVSHCASVSRIPALDMWHLECSVAGVSPLPSRLSIWERCSSTPAAALTARMGTPPCFDMPTWRSVRFWVTREHFRFHFTPASPSGSTYLLLRTLFPDPLFTCPGYTWALFHYF